MDITQVFPALRNKWQASVRTERSSTKAGPGRRHAQGDGQRTAKQKSAGSFGRGIRNAITRKQKAALEAKRSKVA